MTMTKPTSEQVTFTAAGSGATLRNLVDKVREVVSVKDFGAVGDGVTDDAPAIQLAINSIADGTELAFPNGTYALGASGVAINSRSRLVLTGFGAKIKISAISTLPPLPYGGGPISIRFDSCSTCTIRGFEVDGNSIASNPVGLNNCTDCVVEHMEIYAANAYGGVTTSGGLRTTFRHNYIHSAVGVCRGINAGNVTSASHMETDICIESNTVINNSATGIVCSSKGGRVIGNTSQSNAGSGIIFSGFAGNCSSDITCAGNYCSGNLFHGIQSDVIFVTSADLTDGISVVGNICENNTSSGIYAINCQRWSISSNVCRDNGVHGITVDGEFFNVSVTGNVCYDTRSGGSRTQNRGIIGFEQTSSSTANGPIAISGNVCFNNIDAGIYSATTAAGYTVSGLSITGNTCSENARGIVITEVDDGSISNAIVSGNTCLANTTHDLRVSARNVVLGDNMYTTGADLVYALPNNAATPSVLGRKWWQATNGAATSITNFTGGRIGQEIVVTATNANTTINHTATILNNGAANLSVPSGGSVSYVFDGAAWRMLWKSF